MRPPRIALGLLVLWCAAHAAPLGAQAPDAPRPPVPLPAVTLPPALDRVLRDYERAWRARDAAALASIFASDGFVLPNGRPAVRGRAAIRAEYAGAGGPLVLRALHYAVDDTVGYIVGTFATDDAAPPQGKFVLALRRAPRGEWQIAADIDNTDRRPKPRPAALDGAPPPPPTGPR